MRIQTIISLGKTFAMLGILVVALIGMLLLIYNLIAKIRKRKKVSIPIGRLLLYAVFVIYIVIVVGATMLRYSGLSISWENREIYPLFYSYREAWKDFSAREWRNIIFNILMFVPFGFLLPFVSKKFQVFWKTYLVGFLFTFLIEMTQLLLHLGICELDDFMNNTVGAMIGYGFYRLFVFVVQRWKKQETKTLATVCFQIPFLVTLISFALIFGILRYLNSNYSMVLKMNWGFQMPVKSKCIEIYEKDTGDSFHGDGKRYHVFSYKSEDDVKAMFTWSSEEKKTIYHSCYSEAVEEWLDEINVPDEQYPNFLQCLWWYDKQEDNSEIIVMWDSQENKVYIAESFL